MAEYTEKEALREVVINLRLGRHLNKDAALNLMERAIDNLPAADVVEMVHGKWVDHMVRDWRCSMCGEKINKVRNVDGYCYDDKPNYCPNCGAKMDRRDTQ